MRYRLEIRPVAGRQPVETGDGAEVSVARSRRMAPWFIAVAAGLSTVAAEAQSNLDAGKSAAQIFANTCQTCHRAPRELKRSSEGFLRSHYTTSRDEAAAMASYLAGIGTDPRAVEQRRPPGSSPKQGPASDNARAAPPADNGARTSRAVPPADDQGKPSPARDSKARRQATTSEANKPAVVPAPEPPPAQAASPPPAPTPPAAAIVPEMEE